MPIKGTEERAAYMREYRAANRERINTTRREYMYRVHGIEPRTKMSEVERAASNRKHNETYRENNRDKVREASRVWSQANHDYEIDKRLKRLNKHRQAIPAWCETAAIAILYRIRKNRSRYRGEHHVDHVIPLQNDLVCGLHCLDNLEVVPALDNQSKSNSFDQDLESAKQLEISRNR